jgi:carbon-monoxide dehydrogenase medium subunit
MKQLKGFDLLRPRNLADALEMMATFEMARPIAGGSDLIPQFKDEGCKSKNLVDLGIIQELNGIIEEDNRILIGPMTTQTQVASSKSIEKKAPALHDAVKYMGSVQIRNRATIGGNLCNASPAADTALPLLVHSAEVQIMSLHDSCWIPLKDFFIDTNVTILKPDELLTGIRFPVITNASSSFQRIGRRRGFTLSVVNIAIFVKRDRDSLGDVKIAIGAVAPTPIRLVKVEEELRGKKMTNELVEEVGMMVSNAVSPRDSARSSAEYKRDMAGVLARRALSTAWTRVGGEL